MQLSEKRILELARSIAGSDPWSIGCVKFARLLEEEIARAATVAKPVKVYPQGVMGIPPYSPPGSGSHQAHAGLTFNAAQQVEPSEKPTHEFVQFADRTRYVASIDPKAGIRPYPQAAQQQAETGKPVHPGDALGRCFDCMWAGKSKCPHTAQQQVEPSDIPPIIYNGDTKRDPELRRRIDAHIRQQVERNAQQQAEPMANERRAFEVAEVSRGGDVSRDFSGHYFDRTMQARWEKLIGAQQQPEPMTVKDCHAGPAPERS